VRVSRRIRSSQVGCGSTTVRRRLLHTQTHTAHVRPTPLDQSPTTSQMTAIGIGVLGRGIHSKNCLCVRGSIPRVVMS